MQEPEALETNPHLPPQGTNLMYFIKFLYTVYDIVCSTQRILCYSSMIVPIFSRHGVDGVVQETAILLVT